MRIITEGLQDQVISKVTCTRSKAIKGGLLALAGAVRPGYPTGEPLADLQHALDMTDSGPPAFRAQESSRLASNHWTSGSRETPISEHSASRVSRSVE
jgi:hypothetical protein